MSGQAPQRSRQAPDSLDKHPEGLDNTPEVAGIKKSRAKQVVTRIKEKAAKAEQDRLDQQKTLETTRQECIALHGQERPNIPADATMERLQEDIKFKEEKPTVETGSQRYIFDKQPTLNIIY